MPNYFPKRETESSGLFSACRYAYPPNSLSLCGPDKANDLKHYTNSGELDPGTNEILSQFSTLYPYLSLIASTNSIPDPFDAQVVEAYFLGNSLLYKIRKRDFFRHLTETINLKHKSSSKEINLISDKFNYSPLPQHAFHVLNIYKRTGNMDIPHTVETMDACIINYGTVAEIINNKMKIVTQRLKIENEKIVFEKNIIRTVKFQGENDLEAKTLKPGDLITYHWGIFCKKISGQQKINLNYFNNIALNLANIQ